MKITLFERWRKRSHARRSAGTPRHRARQLHLESLENRALLSANSGFSQYDVNHDSYFNISDIVKLVSFVQTNGLNTKLPATSSTSGAASSQALTVRAASATASST